MLVTQFTPELLRKKEIILEELLNGKIIKQ
jgi:hypothetical protein